MTEQPISAEEGALLDAPRKIDISSIISKIRNMLCGDLILSHHLLVTAPISRMYLQDCAIRYAELEEISSRIELGLRLH